MTSDSEWSSVFASPENNVVPGEVLIRLTSDAEAGVEASIPTGPLGAITADLPTSLGISTVDKALAGLKVTAINKLHGPTMPSGLALAAEREMSATYRVRFDPSQDVGEAVDRLSRLRAVDEVSPNLYRETFVTPNDPDFPQQWGLTRINAPAAWDRTKGSASVIVAVLDTGADLDHPDLTSLLVQGRDMVDLPGASPPPGFKFEGDWVTRDSVPQDEVGHGTHVAGTIAAMSNNAVGVAGVNWYTKLMPVKVLTRIVNLTNPADVRGVGSAADIAAGIRWAVDNGAHIINMSLGSSTNTFVEQDAVAYAVANNVVVVAAMGNDNSTAPAYPAAYPNVIAVGATTQSDQRAWFSNMGPHIDVAAPGVGIRSTDWDNTYSNKSGTSMASPHVAGVAALLKACKPSLSAADIGNIIRNTAKPLKDALSDPVPNDKYGHGLVDAEAAVKDACPPVVKPPTSLLIKLCGVSVIKPLCPPVSKPIWTCFGPPKSLWTCPVPTLPGHCPIPPISRLICEPWRPPIPPFRPGAGEDWYGEEDWYGAAEAGYGGAEDWYGEASAAAATPQWTPAPSLFGTCPPVTWPTWLCFPPPPPTFIPWQCPPPTLLQPGCPPQSIPIWSCFPPRTLPPGCPAPTLPPGCPAPTLPPVCGGGPDPQPAGEMDAASAYWAGYAAGQADAHGTGSG